MNHNHQSTFTSRLGSRSKFNRVLREFKQRSLHSGSRRGPVVRSRKQALAIAFSEARRSRYEGRRGRH